jgi:hypothetical protein
MSFSDRNFSNIKLFQAIILFTGLILGFVSCSKKEKVDTSPSLKLSFSADTVFFDTVFTTIGTVNQRLMVYNPNDNKVIVSSIQLAGGSQSLYKMNIDGAPAVSASDVEIPGHDSLFIFVRITIDPNNLNNPLIVLDSILFTTNGNLQDVKLVAWGQDAHFHKNQLLEGSITWDSLKPHVVYGFVRVDTGANLVLMPGTKVYFHKGSTLKISSQASLKIDGSLGHPARFQGDRLDNYYRDLPGQWDGIWLEKGSVGNEINYAIIKNGTVGIYVDSLGNSTEPVLKIDNTIIQNMTGTGLAGYATNIVSTNCVIGNCGVSALDLSFGGSYEFRQLTIGNYWSASVRLSPSLYISDFAYADYGTKVPNPLVKAYFGNCIIYGSENDEILLDAFEGSLPNYSFDHGLLKTSGSIADPLHYTDCIQNEDPRFIDPVNYNYEIDSISPAIQKGALMGVPYDIDINGVERGQTPDLGAYQYVKKR